MRASKVSVTTDTLTLYVEDVEGQILYQRTFGCLLRRGVRGKIGVWKLFPGTSRNWFVYQNTGKTPVTIGAMYFVSRLIEEDMGFVHRMKMQGHAKRVVIEPNGSLSLNFTGDLASMV
jgi:hypothetical protein